MSEPRHIVVVGGGITGLVAARAALATARDRGRALRVTLLESSPRFGGNLLTERRDGYVLDAGADAWVAAKPHATALARDLGLGPSLIGTNPNTRRFYIAWRGALHPVPEGLVLGVPTRLGPLARSRLFTWRGKVRMAIEPFVPVRRFEGDEDESIADFARRRLGREAADRLVAPLLGGISSGDAGDLSVRAAFPQLVAMEREHRSLVLGMLAAARARKRADAGAAGARSRDADDGTSGSAFLSLRGGIGELVDALVDHLKSRGAVLRAGTPATRLERVGPRYAVVLEGEAPALADAVVVAVPAYAAARLLGPGVDRAVAAALSAIWYGTTATVFLSYRRGDIAHPLDGVGFVVPRSLGRPILAGTWISSKWAGRAPEGQALLRAFVGGPAAEELLRAEDDLLVSAVRAELRSWLGVDASPLVHRVFRFERARAQMRVGHLAAVRAIKTQLARVAPEVRIAGDGYEGAGIADCVRQGQEVGAAAAAQTLASTAEPVEAGL
jgi:oxygen-dependent protoporphyrinogen oxidase